MQVRVSWWLGFGMAMVWGVAGVWPQSAQAQELPDASPGASQTAQSQNPEDSLRQRLQGLDQAASQENLDGVLQYYSPNFVHGDGLTRSTLEQALQEFWDRYNNLDYQTELLSWQQTDQGLMAETETKITGTEELENRNLLLEGTLKTRQYWQDQQIVREEIMAEYSQVQTGEHPPTLAVNLPEEVQVNQPFNFDVIVEEPLADDLLLGGILDEPVRQNRFFDLTEMDVEPLTAGGLFKIGRAPAVRDNRWISAVIIRKGGITFFTQRLRIVEPTIN